MGVLIHVKIILKITLVIKLKIDQILNMTDTVDSKSLISTDVL